MPITKYTEEQGGILFESEESAIAYAAEFNAVLFDAPQAGIVTPPAARPLLVITSVSADATNAARTAITPELNDVTCPAGTVLNISAQVQIGGAPLSVTATFRMPIVARDGREKVLLVALVGGVANFNAPMRESGVWEVTQAIINQGLPAAEQMDFAGITIYVVEAE